MANPRIIAERSELQPLADSIKTLQGSSGAITLDGMKSAMRAANTEVASQADIISQISDTLDDKSVGGASVGGNSAESQLTSNTEDLQLILARVNSMPQVGSGGSANPVLQVKSVTPAETAQSIIADAGYDGLSKVNVAAIPDNYADTSDANATVADMIAGKSAYVNGEKITGALDLYIGSADLGANNAASWNADKNGIEVVFNANERLVLEQNFKVIQHVAGDKLGDATPANVAKGKTFTSANGMKIVGTNEGTGSGIDTSDATALPEDIVAGETAYVNGEKITGTMEEIGYINEDATYVGENQDKDTIVVASLNVDSPKRAVLYGAVINVPKSEFGDAAPSDVAKGKTFTSISGLQVIGTNEDINSGIDTSDATAVAEDMREGVTAYVNGEKITGNVPYWGKDSIVSDPSPLCEWDDENDRLALVSYFPRAMTEEGLELTMYCDGDRLGDASAADVVAGKTFTSANGVKLVGTNSGESGGGPYSKAEIITWIPSSDTYVLSFNHSLGVVPDGFNIIAKDNLSNLDGYILTVNMDVGMLYYDVYKFVTGVSYDTSSSGNSLNAILMIVTDFENDITAQDVNLALMDDYTFKAGSTYEILVYKR